MADDSSWTQTVTDSYMDGSRVPPQPKGSQAVRMGTRMDRWMGPTLAGQPGCFYENDRPRPLAIGACEVADTQCGSEIR